MDSDELDWMVPHQANIRIISAVAKRIQTPIEHLYQQALNDLEVLSVDTMQLRELTLKLQDRKF
jgi:hypothetical protein